jgi:hypothetical protein
VTVRVLRLSARCPECRTSPRLRTFPETRDIFLGVDPERVVQTYECHVRSCGCRYEIRVKDFVEAS